MSIQTSLRWMARGAVIGALGAFSMGCGGIEPGDYVIYRVALEETSLSGDCVSDDPNDKDDSDSFLESGTFILYAGLEDTFYLDLGESTLEGTLEGDIYSFAGERRDINFTGINDSDKVTSTDRTNVEATVDGESMSGSFTTKATVTCAGTCTGFEKTTCSSSTSFVGTEIEEITLEYGL